MPRQPTGAPRESNRVAVRSADLQTQRSAWRWIRAAAVVVTLWFAYQLLLIAQAWALAIFSIVIYVVFGGALALITLPLVDWLERRRIPRRVAVALVVVGGFAALVAIGYFVGTDLVAEGKGLVAQLPGWVGSAEHLYQSRISPLLSSHNIHLSIPGLTGGGASGFLRPLLSRLPAVLFAGLSHAIQIAATAVIAVVVWIWLLADGRSMRNSTLGLLPAGPRSAAAFTFDAVATVFGGYVRAQLSIACLIGALAGLGTAILGVPYPMVIGVVAAVFELVPIVGPFAGGAVALLLALTVSPWLMIWTLLLFLGIHVLEGYVLAPRIQAHFVRIHPLAAFLALLAGIEVGGFIGALFAIPVASTLAVLLKAGLEDWRVRHPEAFRQAAEDPFLERRRVLLDRFGATDRGGRGSRSPKRLAMDAWAAFRSWTLGHQRVAAALRFGRRHWLKSIALFSLLGLIIAVHPGKVLAVFRHAELPVVLLMLPVVLLVYVFRGLGWWVTLRRVGVDISPFRSVYIMFTGQTMIFLPTGDLARVELVERTGASGRDQGTIAGTIAFQELMYLGLLGLGVLPKVFMGANVALLVVLLALTHAGIIVLIVWKPAYERALRIVERFRVLKRFDPQLRHLRQAFVCMLDAGNLAGVLGFNAVAAGLQFLLFWLALVAVGAGGVGFSEATFAYGLAHILAGMSLLPGGVGSLEAIITALLSAKGIAVSTGAAGALLYRGFNDVVMAAAGLGTSLLVRRAADERSRRGRSGSRRRQVG